MTSNIQENHDASGHQDGLNTTVRGGRGRGRPPGRGRGQGRGGSVVVATAPPTEVKTTRPKRTNGKYQPGQAIIDTPSRRTSAQVQQDKIAAQLALKKQQANAEAQKKLQCQQIAAIEDSLRAEENAQQAISLRPDLAITPSVLKPLKPSLDDNVHTSNHQVYEAQADEQPCDEDHDMSMYDEGSDYEPEPTFMQQQQQDYEGDDDDDGPPSSGPDLSNSSFELSCGEGYTDKELTDVELPHATPTTAIPTRPTYSKPSSKVVRGEFRQNVNQLHRVSAVRPPSAIASTKRKQVSVLPGMPADESAQEKRPRPAPPPGESGPSSGLIPNWRRKIPAKLPKQPEAHIEDDPQVMGEFDYEDSPQDLEVARAAKPTVVVHSHLSGRGVGNISITEQPITEAVPNKRRRRETHIVANLPLNKSTSHTLRWKKAFRHTITAWAATHKDPYGTNALITQDLTCSIWQTVFPEIPLKEAEGKQPSTLDILVAVSGGILIDWRSAIGMGALSTVHEFFTTNAFTKNDIQEYVQWAYQPPHSFNFIYANPDAEPGHKGGLRSDLVLDIFALHIKRVGSAVINYPGFPVGAMGLCVAALERAISLWSSGEDPALRKVRGNRQPISAFGEAEWGPRVRAWAHTADRLTEADWVEILAEATARAKLHGEGVGTGDGADAPGDQHDPRMVIEL